MKLRDVHASHWSQGLSLAEAERGGAAPLAVMPRAAGLARSVPSTILARKGIKVTSGFDGDDEEGFIRIVELACKRWQCKDCRLSKGIRVRESLLAKQHLFKEPRLYTLTVNREWFPSPLEAYHYVMGGKFLARLLTKEMGVRRWFWVLEAQEETGDGWPHWHILMDVSALPPRWYSSKLKKSRKTPPKDLTGWLYIPHFFDLNKVNSLIQKWHISRHCHLSERRAEFLGPAHAVNYITKYLVKPPRRGNPKWMLEERRIRFCQPSYEIGAIIGDGKKRPPKGESGTKRRRAEERPPVERVAECRARILPLKYSGLLNKSLPMTRYDAESERHLRYAPSLGMKAGLDSFPGATWISGFDSRSGKAYKIYGFAERRAAESFMGLWRSPDLSELVRRKVEAKRLSLLSAWAGPCGRDAGGASAARLSPGEPPRDFSFRPPASPQAAKAEPSRQAEAEAAGLSEGRLPSLSGSTRSGEKLAAGCEHCQSPPLPGDEGKSRQLDLFESLSKTA